jgi:DNA polymerase-1
MGFSAFDFSNQTRTFRSESAALIEPYYQSYPQLKSYISNQVDFARDGYVQTVLGRRRYLKILTPKMPLYEVVQSVMP